MAGLRDLIKQKIAEIVEEELKEALEEVLTEESSEPEEVECTPAKGDAASGFVA